VGDIPFDKNWMKKGKLFLIFGDTMKAKDVDVLFYRENGDKFRSWTFLTQAPTLTIKSNISYLEPPTMEQRLQIVSTQGGV